MRKNRSSDWQLLLCSGAEHLEEEFVRSGYSVSKSERNYDGARQFANSDVYTRIAAIDRFQGKRVCILQSFTASGKNSAHNFTTGDRFVEVLQVLDILSRPRSVAYVDGERRYTELERPHEIVVLALHSPFSKQDKIYSTGESNACHMAIRTMFAAGTNRIVLIDFHVPLNFTWFHGYVNSGKVVILSMYDRVVREFKQKQEFGEIVFVSTPGKKRSPIGHDLAQVDKKRVSTHVVLIKGQIDESLRGKRIFLIDDMVISGTTIKNARRFFYDQGAADVYCWITHALPYAQGKEENLRHLVDAFDQKLFVSNTVRSETFQKEYPRCLISCVPLIIEEFLCEVP